MSVAVDQRISSNWWLILLQGIAVLMLGIFLLISPGMTSLVLVSFIGVYWLVSGMFSIIGIFTGDSQMHWIWSLLIGILGILAGLAVLRHPLYSTVLVPTVLVVILGIDGLIMGVMYLIRGFQGDGLGNILLGILNVLIGLFLAFNPLAGALALPFVLGIFGIVGGIALMVVAFRVKA